MKAWRRLHLYSVASVVTFRVMASLPIYLISSIFAGLSILFLWTAEVIEGTNA